VYCVRKFEHEAKYGSVWRPLSSGADCSAPRCSDRPEVVYTRGVVN